MSNPFQTIYEGNLWNGKESRSGPGSGPAATSTLTEALRVVLHITEAESVLDVACGDGYWMPDLPGYVGVDIAPTAIALARLHHPERHYMVADIRQDPVMRQFGLIICRDAMQHMSLSDGVETMRAIKDTGTEWLLASTYVGGENIDIPTGLDSDGDITFYCPDLTKPPFGLMLPRILFPDGYDYGVPGWERDPRKMLGLWNLWTP